MIANCQSLGRELDSDSTTATSSSSNRDGQRSRPGGHLTASGMSVMNQQPPEPPDGAIFGGHKTTEQTKAPWCLMSICLDRGPASGLGLGRRRSTNQPDSQALPTSESG